MRQEAQLLLWQPIVLRAKVRSSKTATAWYVVYFNAKPTVYSLWSQFLDLW